MPHYADTTRESAAEAQLWEKISAHAGENFRTFKGLTFTYTLRGGEMFISRKEKSITRSSIMGAYRTAARLMAAEGSVAGPKKLGTFGASYLYPIFETLGVLKRPGPSQTPEKDGVPPAMPHKHIRP